MSDQKNPLLIKETAGTKFYCSCNRSKNFPYCDGGHAGTDHLPHSVEIEEDKTVAICNCGKSKNPPFCDGSHK